MRKARIAALALVGAMVVAVPTAHGDGSSGPVSAPACSTAVAGGPAIRSAAPIFTRLRGNPFGVAAARGYAFVATLTGGLDVLADHDSAPHLVHRIGLRGGQGVGVALTTDGRYLLVADGRDGAYVVGVARAERGDKDALLGTLGRRSSARLGGGAIEVAASRDGRYAFVSLEGSDQIAVYRLAAAIAGHFATSTYVGAVPTGIAPVGLAVSPDGRWLYSTSEIARPGHPGTGQIGSLSVISVVTAEHDPTRAVVATVAAGCNPVRVAVSPTGRYVWVTARESDELLAFSASRLVAHASGAEVAKVRVGEAPVGLALVDAGSRIVVADSNRFGAGGRGSGLTVVSTAAALAHRAAIVGTIRSGLFPREMALEPAGTVLLVGNFQSGTLESVHV